MKKIFSFLVISLMSSAAFCAVELREEGTRVGVVEEVNFVGSNVTVTKSGGIGIVTVAEDTEVSTLTVSGATALNGGITCDTDKFTVADTTGNTAIAGTLQVDGNIDVNADIVGDGGGEISGMLSDIEIGVTDDTLTVAESGKVFVCTANCTKTLPAAADGVIYSIVDGEGVTVNVDPNGTDAIVYAPSGVDLSAGDKITSTGATADSVTLIGDSNGKWYVVAMKGTWTDGN